jgi:fucokinase
MARWDAIHDDGTVQIDTGLVWLDAETAGEYADLLAQDAVAACCGQSVPNDTEDAAGGLNLYGDLLMPLAESTGYDEYLQDTSDGPATPAIQAAREVIWERVCDVPFSVERLQPAVFGHFGTSREYWGMVAADPDLRRMCGWTEQATAWVDPTVQVADEDWTLINAAVSGPVEAGQRPALVMDSHLSGPFSWQGASLVTGLRTHEPLSLGKDLVVHQLPMTGGYVTRLYGLHDDPKLAFEVSDATYCNRPWAEWLEQAGLPADVLWPEGPRTLWNARLYPVAADREESLRLSLPLANPAEASADWWARWQAAERLSLAESYFIADGERILADLSQVEEAVAVGRYCEAIEAEQPAVECAPLLGHDLATRRRRSGAVQARLATAAPILQLRGYPALAEATGDAQWGDKAFSVLSTMVRGSLPAMPTVQRSSEVPGVRVEAPARIDFGGGWTDTPPYSIERGGTVLNAALTLRGRRPITAEARWLDEPALILECRDIDAHLSPESVGQVLDYADPADPFALLKAAVVMRGIVPLGTDPDTPIVHCLDRWEGGLHLSTGTSIPRGSGLGTSSILAGAVLMALARLLDLDPTSTQLADEVLALEQMLTTGGGWQDQVGGLTGGIKLITTAPGLPQRAQVAPLDMSVETAQALAERLLVVYTGQQRLAKDLLRAVMGRWMLRDREMVDILAEIARLARAMAQALEEGDIDAFGGLVAEHWTLNKRMDPGCSNAFIDGLFNVMDPYISGAKVAGAGGGGFAIVVVRDAEAAKQLPAVLNNNYPHAPAAVWPSAIPQEAMRVHQTEVA